MAQPGGQRACAAAKTASGGAAWDRLSGWDETGSHGGANYETKLDPHEYGMVSITFRDGGKSTWGFNGVVAWRTGADGKTEIHADPAHLADGRQSAYASMSGSFPAGPVPGEVHLPGWEKR